MAIMYCGACGAQFTWIRDFDKHLILYPDMERPDSVTMYDGRPKCVGERDGVDTIDQSKVEALRARGQRLHQKAKSGAPVSGRAHRAVPAHN